MAKQSIVIYTDGACSDNQRKINRGGWGAVIIYPDQQLEIYGGEANKTNNRMELIACINALETVKSANMPATIYSDSAYLVNCINQKWYAKWQRNGWLTSKKQPVENQDLWEKIIDQINEMKVTFKKVAGHAGVELNELADRLANKGIEDPDHQNPQMAAQPAEVQDLRYSYRKVDSGYLLRLNVDAPVMETLLAFITRYRISSGVVSGIGALKDITLGYYRLPGQTYERREFKDIHELTSFNGNISTVDGKPFIHAHASLADDRFQMVGGHFFDGIVAITMEAHIIAFEENITRSKDSYSGLNLLDL